MSGRVSGGVEGRGMGLDGGPLGGLRIGWQRHVFVEPGDGQVRRPPPVRSRFRGGYRAGLTICG